MPDPNAANLRDSSDSEIPPTVAMTPGGEAIAPAPALTELDQRGYHLMEVLGKGGMGEVYRACDPALERELAIKVIKADYHDQPQIEGRFLREARITGSLQHPGIVAVHNLGRLPDGRLHYTMRLVRGRTFADILKEQAGKPEHLPALLSIFEKICQAVAYAHSKHVIHRDLKPSNVMVGRFGEVQVMDWGLAKLLSVPEEADTGAPAADVTGTRIHAEPGDTPVEMTQGPGLGSPPYMPLEQALGEWGMVDERADVFALGAILCEMLTGHPPYTGQKREEVKWKAKRGDLTEAQARLEQCGADESLKALCRACLAVEREDRPRDADAVRQRVALYQAEVQERLRRAELERVAAETTAREEKARATVEEERAREAWRRVVAERRARWRALALGAAVVVLLAGGGAAWWWQQHHQQRTDQAVDSALDKAEWLENQAQQAPVEMVTYHEALEVARGAVELAQGASRKQQQRAGEVVERLEKKERRIKRDQRLLTALLEAYGPQESPPSTRDEKGRVMALGEPMVEEQLASAFREWGLDVDAVPTAEAAARLNELPHEVRTEAIAGLDEWAQERRLNKRPQPEWRRLADLAAALDENPGSKRRELRVLLESGRLSLERALAVLGAALRPVPLPVETPLGPARGRIRQMAAEVNVAEEPVLGLLLLTRALRAAGEEGMAERILRDAIQARPREVVLYHALTQVLKEQEPPRWAEAVEFYQAARALRPDLGVDLAVALLQTGRHREAEDLVERMLNKQDRNPYLHYLRGYAFYNKGRYAQAEEAFGKAIQLKPDYVDAYLGLGVALNDQLKYEEAEQVCRRALAHKPDGAAVYLVLGIVLSSQDKHAQAEAAYRQAIQLQADFVDAHIALGVALNDQKKHRAAEEVCRQALKLRPEEADAFTNLGVALLGQTKLAEAEAACRRALELQPDHAEGHCNLGDVLRQRGRLAEALAAYRRGHELGSKLPGWRYPSRERIGEVEQLIQRK